MARILLVEDDLPVQRMYHNALAEEYDVLSVESSREAIAAVDEFQPDLIVLDLNLPDAPGATVIEYVQATGAAAKIIVLTGFVQNRRPNLPDAVVEMLHKPVTTSTLLRVIRAALSSQISR
ncbi:MAG: response regulator [Anaerolineales bacterium]